MTKKRAKGIPGVSASRVIVPVSAGTLALRSRAARQTDDYGRLVSDISGLLEEARRSAARSVNNLLGCRTPDRGIRTGGQGLGREYGKQLLARLGADLTTRHGRGFSRQGLQKMRSFYMGWEICPTPSGKSEARAKCPMVSGEFKRGKPETSLAQSPQALAPVHAPIQPPFASAVAFPLSWSQYVRLMSVDNPRARAFCEVEAIRGGWSVRQLDRQISTQFYDRAVRSKRPHDLLTHGHSPQRQDMLYHRGLRCLVVIDLKTGAFTHADAGQMNLYLNFVKEHLMISGEAEPVGIILCSDKDDAIVKYATGGILTRVFASKYLTNLPDAETLRREIVTTQRSLRARWK